MRNIAAHDAATRISRGFSGEVCFAIHEQLNASEITKVRRAVQWSAATGCRVMLRKAKMRQIQQNSGQMQQLLEISCLNIRSTLQQQIAGICVAVGTSVMKGSVVKTAMRERGKGGLS